MQLQLRESSKTHISSQKVHLSSQRVEGQEAGSLVSAAVIHEEWQLYRFGASFSDSLNWQWTSCVSFWWLRNRTWTWICRGENLVFDNWRAHLIVPATSPFFIACFSGVIELKAKTPSRAVSFDNGLLNGVHLSLKIKSSLSGSWQSSFWTWLTQWREWDEQNVNWR